MKAVKKISTNGKVIHIYVHEKKLPIRAVKAAVKGSRHIGIQPAFLFN